MFSKPSPFNTKNYLKTLEAFWVKKKKERDFCNPLELLDNICNFLILLSDYVTSHQTILNLIGIFFLNNSSVMFALSDMIKIRYYIYYT